MFTVLLIGTLLLPYNFADTEKYSNVLSGVEFCVLEFFHFLLYISGSKLQCLRCWIFDKESFK